MRRRCPRCVPHAVAALIITALLVLNTSSGAETVQHGDASTVEAEPYTRDVSVHSEDHTHVYGVATSLRQPDRPLVPAATYSSFVANMPIVCVDVALTRSDGRVLLVKRHSEPVKGLYWWPGGRLLLGESFAEAAVRKVRHEIGVGVTACAAPLLTANTLFERSAWGGATHTVNVLMHAVTDDAAAHSGLPICGDQAGRCAATGEHGFFKWITPAASAEEAPYVLEGLAALRARGGRCVPLASANPLQRQQLNRTRALPRPSASR